MLEIYRLFFGHPIQKILPRDEIPIQSTLHRWTVNLQHFCNFVTQFNKHGLPMLCLAVNIQELISNDESWDVHADSKPLAAKNFHQSKQKEIDPICEWSPTDSMLHRKRLAWKSAKMPRFSAFPWFSRFPHIARFCTFFGADIALLISSAFALPFSVRVT